MLAPEQTVTELALPALELRGAARRLVVPVALAALAAAAIFLLGGHVQAFADALVRGLGVSPAWAIAAVLLEAASLAGYVLLLSLVASRATPRIGTRESAEITLAGAAATRLLPTAGAGGIALALWALRRAGLGAGAATRTLLSFLVLLYAVFLGSIVLAGGALALGLVHSGGPEALSAIPAAVAALLIAAALGFARAGRRPGGRGGTGRRGAGRGGAGRAGAGGRGGTGRGRAGGAGGRAVRSLPSRLHHGGLLVGAAVGDAVALVRTADRRLARAVGYWMFDAAVLWAMLHAFGAAPSPAVVALAYFVGQAANTLPIPGSVSGGVAGVLVAFGVPIAVALPAVLAYRAIAVWLPAPFAAAAIPRLRATVARWGAEGVPS